jgi:hypothetical protein
LFSENDLFDGVLNDNRFEIDNLENELIADVRVIRKKRKQRTKITVSKKNIGKKPQIFTERIIIVSFTALSEWLNKNSPLLLKMCYMINIKDKGC